MSTLSMLVSNLHCPSCVCHIEDVLASLPGVHRQPDISLIEQVIKVRYDEEVSHQASIVDALLSAAFEVQHVTLYDHKGQTAREYSVGGERRESTVSKEIHRQNCYACQEDKCNSQAEDQNDKLSMRKPIPTDKPAIITVDQPSQDEIRMFAASISIEGMTCGSCVGTVSSGLRDLSFVFDTSVDLLTNAATVKFQGRGHLDQILETIDNLGYDAALIDVSEVEESRFAPKERRRVVEFEIKGMHCTHCPQRVVDKIESFRRSLEGDEVDLQITKPPTLSLPIVQLKYNPSELCSVNIRTLLSLFQSVDPYFSASVYQPPTVEERSKLLQQKERQEILIRLLFTGIISIPSFILGVVYMALVPHHNPTRMWFEESIGIGNASRFEWALFIMTTPVMFFGADMFHKRALKEIWAMWRPKSVIPFFQRFYRFGSMNMLISVGTMVAYVSSLVVLIMESTSNHLIVDENSRMSATYFDVITFLTFFILLGKYLEAYSKAKTGDTIAMLCRLKPEEAQLIENGSMRKIPVAQLEIGDTVQIPQGHSPPADGIVRQDGSFSFDESSLTGESKPVSKTVGDPVFTGTVNVADSVEVKITELGGSSMLDQIIHVVRAGQTQRAPVERVADILTGYFVPVVTLIAFVTWMTWLSLGLSGSLPIAWLDSRQGGWAFWSVEFAIAVFVIACPCGIGLAAPTALFVGGGLAAKEGILAQGGGQAFQEASNLSTIVFDKTGTLTQGQMKVVEYEHLSDTLNSNTIFAMSKALESASNHPIAQAIAQFCSSDEQSMAVTSTKEMPGYGMTGTLRTGPNAQQRTFEAAIGNEKLIDSLNMSRHSESSNPETVGKADTHLQQRLHEHRSQGRSIAILAVREETLFHVVGLFALDDTLRPEAFEVVSSLRALNISVHLCTGDNEITASAVASRLAIPRKNVCANVLPQGKAEYVHQLQHTDARVRKLVGFVGDGINDTPALTAADVSISLSSGSDIAMNASSFILLNSRLSAICSLMKLSKRVFRRVKINFFWAALYNVTLIPVAAGVLFPIGATNNHGGFRLSPVWAAVAMAGSSVSVVLSSLALRLPELQWNKSKNSNSNR